MHFQRNASFVALPMTCFTTLSLGGGGQAKIQSALVRGCSSGALGEGAHGHVAIGCCQIQL